MAAQEPDAGGATAPAEIAGSEELVITAANVRQVPLDKIPSKTKAWDPIALEVFLEVAEVLFSRWGLLKFVMDEMTAGEQSQKKYDYMIEDFEMNVRDYWEKKGPLAWETTEDFCIEVLSSDFHVDFEDGSESGLIKMAKRMSSVYDAASQGDLRWAISTLKFEDEKMDAAAGAALTEASDEEDSSDEEGTTAAPASTGDDGWTTVATKKGKKKGKKSSGGESAAAADAAAQDGSDSESEED